MCQDLTELHSNTHCHMHTGVCSTASSLVQRGYLVKWQNDKSTATGRLDHNGHELTVDGTEATIMSALCKAKSFIALFLLSYTAVHVTEFGSAHEHLHMHKSARSLDNQEPR